jgi:hypothetical protein
MIRNAIVFCACVSFACANPAQAATLTTTYQSYNPRGGKFNLTQTILYQLPNPATFGSGPYPVAMWTPGTLEPYNDILGQAFIASMALRGFIGATVQYSNTNAIQTCTDYTERAQGVYDSTRSTSAVEVMCALPQASCAKGVVTAGISQGAAMAVLSKNYASIVDATYAMSVSDALKSGRLTVNLSACLDKSKTQIPADRLTIVNGIADAEFGGQTPLMNVSGFTCASGTFQCWSPDGSGAGWYIIQNSQVEDGVADHCYELVGGCTGTSFDPNWIQPASFDWSFGPNLDWLASLGQVRVFSPTGE